MTFKNEHRLRILLDKLPTGRVGDEDITELKKLTLNLLEVAIAKDQELERFLDGESKRDAEEVEKRDSLFYRLKHSHKMNSMPEGLPDSCYVYLHGNQPGTRIGMIRKGYLGFFTAGVDSTHWVDQKAKQVVESMNDDMNLTPVQVECMEAGSMFGWFCPGADPANYDEKGKFIHEV